MQDKQRNRRQPPGRFPLSAFRFLPSPTPARQGFTLTELLIVIAIIAVLAGLIAAAAVNALRSAKRSQITLEMKNMSGVVENLKTEFGAYPPNGMSLDLPTRNRVEADYVRMFRKAFPRMNPQEEQVVRALAGVDMVGTVVKEQRTTNGMNAAEAVYFWLGGFSSDTQFPLSGPKGPSYGLATGQTLEDREIRYEFDLGRLRPRDEDGDLDTTAVRFVRYEIDLNGDSTIDPDEKRRIDLWRYTPKGSEEPLFYFDVSRYKPRQYDLPATADDNVYAFKTYKEGRNKSVPATLDDIVFVEKKFQILHCGLDDDWGTFGPSASASPSPPIADVEAYMLPNGVFIGPNADTQTNFIDGTIEDEVEE